MSFFFSAKSITVKRFPFIKIEGGKLVNTNITVSAGVILTNGTFGEKAALLDGDKKFLNFGKSVLCISDLEKCSFGITVTFNLKLLAITKEMYIFSNGGNIPDSQGMAMWISKGFLFLSVSTKTKLWVVKTKPFTVNLFFKLSFSWSQQDGLFLFFNDKQIAHQKQFIEKTVAGGKINDLYIGRDIKHSTSVHIAICGWNIVSATKKMIEDLGIEIGK